MSSAGIEPRRAAVQPQASLPTTRSATTSEHGHDDPGQPPSTSGRPVSPQVAGDGLLVGGDLAGQRRDGLGRGGWAEPVGATLLPGQPRRHDLEAAGAGEAEAEWLVDLDATHSRRVDARLARRQQTAARVQAAQAVAGQPEAPEGEHVGRHGEGRDEDQDEEHVDPPGEPAHPLGALDDELALVAEAGEALGEEAETCGSRGEARRRERCVADPGRIEPQQHLFVGHGRHVDAGDEGRRRRRERRSARADR